jgi:HSP20 family protein
VALADPARCWAAPPAVDIAEKDKSYEITAELPGLDEKNVEVKVANGMLTIKGEKKEEKNIGEQNPGRSHPSTTSRSLFARAT